MKRLLRKLWLGALATFLMVPASVVSAHAAVLNCGDVVLVNTVLENDVGPCSNNGLVIGASGITLDLNGHTVRGRETRTTGDGAGILLRGRSNVTVRNGTVRDFDIGVAIEGGSGNTVEGINAVDNITYESAPGRVGGDGIAILSSQNNRVLHNNAVNNGPYSGIGLYSDVDSAHPRTTTGVSSGNLVDGNAVVNNIEARTPNNVVNNDNIGIRMEPGNSGNTISNNSVRGNGLDGITLFVRNSFNTLRGNTVADNGFYRRTARRGNGIGLQMPVGSQAPVGANNNLVEFNVVTRNADNGIVIRNVSQNNVVRFNIAVNNAVLPPVSPNFGPTFDLNDNNPNCDNNVWLDNHHNTANPPCAADRP